MLTHSERLEELAAEHERARAAKMSAAMDEGSDGHDEDDHDHDARGVMIRHERPCR